MDKTKAASGIRSLAILRIHDAAFWVCFLQFYFMRLDNTICQFHADEINA